MNLIKVKFEYERFHHEDVKQISDVDLDVKSFKKTDIEKSLIAFKKSCSGSVESLKILDICCYHSYTEQDQINATSFKNYFIVERTCVTSKRF